MLCSTMLLCWCLLWSTVPSRREIIATMLRPMLRWTIITAMLGHKYHFTCWSLQVDAYRLRPSLAGWPSMPLCFARGNSSNFHGEQHKGACPWLAWLGKETANRNPSHPQAWHHRARCTGSMSADGGKPRHEKCCHCLKGSSTQQQAILHLNVASSSSQAQLCTSSMTYWLWQKQTNGSAAENATASGGGSKGNLV